MRKLSLKVSILLTLAGVSFIVFSNVTYKKFLWIGLIIALAGSVSLGKRVYEKVQQKAQNC